MSISRLALCSGKDNAWDIGFAQYNPSKSLSWNLSTASFTRSFSVFAQEGNPRTVFFKPDGLKMYVLGTDDDRIYEYNLSIAWNVSTAVYAANFFGLPFQSFSTGLFFKPDGTKMYVVGNTGQDVNEYNLSTAWNVSTATFVQSFSVSTQDTEPHGLFFKPDGFKMYVVGITGQDVNEYNLSTAWNISTAAFVQSFSVSAQDTFPTDVFFKPDGTKMYVLGTTGDDVNEYNLSTAWNVSTATFVQSFSVSTQDTGLAGLFFKPDGTKMYVVGLVNDNVNEYDLGGFSIALQETFPTDVFFKPDGLKMYVVGVTGDNVNEYNLSTAWEISTAAYAQNFSVSVQDTQPAGVSFKPDGLKMYVLGFTGQDVNEYNLSTAWNISTATFVQSFSVSAQETAPQALFFKPDGFKMYVVGTTGDDVNEYNLSTAWNISTAAFVQSFSVSTQDTQPAGVSFKPDGLKMYVLGVTGDNVNEYNLSTAWNVSTAVFSQLFSLAAQESALFFKPDGKKFYTVSSVSDKIYQYRIG